MGEKVVARTRLLAGTVIAFMAVAVLSSWGWRIAKRDGGHGHDDSGAAGLLRLGLPDSPLLGVAYQAQDVTPGAWLTVRAKTANDVGYALLAGTVEAGFVEAAKAKALLAGRDASSLHVIGAVTFPYGATVVGRKGTVARLEDLAGRRLAVTSPTSALLAQLSADVKARGLDPASWRLVPLPFDGMVPALESGEVDAAVLRGELSLVAAKAGHPVIYQNWQMQPGDECCPPVIPQTEYLLLARGHHPGLYALVAALAVANEAKPSLLRQAAARITGFPDELLTGFPVASFIIPDAKALAAFGRHNHHAD